jgi:hypothetical protein
VTLSWAGLRDCSSGSRSLSVCSVSSAVSVRSCGMTSPSASGGAEESLSNSSETNFSPNSVLGSSRARASDGICSAASGRSATEMVAPEPSVSTSRMSPTTSPRALTSPPVVSWLPIVPVCTATITTGVNAFWYSATVSATRAASTARNSSPASCCVTRLRPVTSGGGMPLPLQPVTSVARLFPLRVIPHPGAGRPASCA